MPTALAYDMVIELLAYQFASPVQWIKTQDVLFQRPFGRLVEIGPAPTLQNMGKRTLSSLLKHRKKIKSWDLLWYGKNQDDIYFNLENKGDDAASYARSQVAAKVQVTSATAATASALTAEAQAEDDWAPFSTEGWYYNAWTRTYSSMTKCTRKSIGWLKKEEWREKPSLSRVSCCDPCTLATFGPLKVELVAPL